MISDDATARPTGRKGIYQSFDAAGSITADERWRWINSLDGAVRIDTETVRIAPDEEPRSEAVSLELSPNLSWRRLVIHALSGKRESRIDFADGRVNLCWRVDEISRTRDYEWTDDCEIDYNSALFNMVILWRNRLAPGQTRNLRVVSLDKVTFEPKRLMQVYTHLGNEQRETPFGRLKLEHIRLDLGGNGERICHLWCDSSGVVFDYAASNGGGFRLVAVNFPS
ncbi:MAG: putative glycolipid-binding domain-containing protein [Chloroflexi bacterium]|nr:putative glycolipid-binding domain-containing protein [Chloroflexota bacterium]MCL5275836.1 putative glycolipid-binding domain-containing protein [Chloroflexota bacterium]